MHLVNVVKCSVWIFIISVRSSKAEGEWCSYHTNCGTYEYCCTGNRCCSSTEYFGSSSDISRSGTLAVGVVAAIVIGGIIFCIACVVGCVICCRRTNQGHVVGRPMTTTTIHTRQIPATNPAAPMIQPQYPLGPAPAPAYMPAPAGPPAPYPQAVYPPAPTGYPSGPVYQPPMPANPPAYSDTAAMPSYPVAPNPAQPPYPTKDSVQASAPPPY